MDEPALVAVIGVGGVLVGAVGSGGVQAYLSRADRRRDARSGARLLYMQLHDAQAAVEELRERRDWDQMITDWDAYAVAWDRHSESLARVIATTPFHTVSSAFACLASLSNGRTLSAREPPPTPTAPVSAPPNFPVADGLLGLYVANLNAAKLIVLKASFRWWEHRARKKALAG